MESVVVFRVLRAKNHAEETVHISGALDRVVKFATFLPVTNPARKCSKNAGIVVLDSAVTFVPPCAAFAIRKS